MKIKKQGITQKKINATRQTKKIRKKKMKQGGGKKR